MKKLLKISMFMILTICFVAGSAMAFPFLEVEGYVDPSSATVVDNEDGTSTITGLTYIFTVADDGGTGAEMNYLSVEFENDVFASVSTAYGYSPDDWETSGVDSTNSWYILSTAGTTIDVGESLSFVVDVVIYNAALTNASLWSEGQIWGQSWLAGDTLNGGDGGSTAPVPEPATMMLLGSGLIGLAGVSRKKLKKA